MNQQEKIKLLAIKVMEIKVMEWNEFGDWNPYEKWSDCGMLIEKIQNQRLVCIDNGNGTAGNWQINIRKSSDGELLAYLTNDSLTHAITEAIYKAYRLDDKE